MKRKMTKIQNSLIKHCYYTLLLGNCWNISKVWLKKNSGRESLFQFFFSSVFSLPEQCFVTIRTLVNVKKSYRTQNITTRNNICIKALLITSVYSIVKLLFTSIAGSFTYAQKMLYMLFFVSCIYSLKKSPSETKRIGNKRKNLQLQEVFLCAALVSVKK